MVAPMTCVVLSIGTELTRGELINSNAAWLAAELVRLGFDVDEHVTVDDDEARIVAALARLSGRARVLVCTGGLGPTTDDLTSAAVAQWLGVGLVRDAASLEAIRRRFERLGREMSASNAKQADFPEDSTILENPIGTAPGFFIEKSGCLAFFMPGVPREMKRMFDEQVVPRIGALAPATQHQIHFRTFGLPESVVGERLAGIEEAHPGVTIGYRAHFPEIEVKTLARAASPEQARGLAERAAEQVRVRLADVVYGGAEDSFAGAVAKALRGRGKTLAIAESCTGGLVGHMLTREAGASEFLLLDAVTYANSAKTRVLGVSEELIRHFGAVSEECARAMAEGARRVADADYALAITGIAGPGGGTDEKPVGTVFFAVASEGETTVKRRHWSGDRGQVQTIAAYLGLELVRRAVTGALPEAG